MDEIINVEFFDQTFLVEIGLVVLVLLVIGIILTLVEFRAHILAHEAETAGQKKVAKKPRAVKKRVAKKTETE